MGQWLQRAFDRMRMVKHVWFPTRRKSNRRHRYRIGRRRVREMQVYESDDSYEDEQCSQPEEYLDIFTTEDEYGTIKKFSHRIPLGLREPSMTPEQEDEESPSPVSLTRYFAVEKEDDLPNNAIVRLDTEDSLGFANCTQTKFDETIAGLSFHTPPPPLNRKDSQKMAKEKRKLPQRKPPQRANSDNQNVCEVLVQPAKRVTMQIKAKRKDPTGDNKPRKHMATKDNTYFDQLIRALSRKYWHSNSMNENKGKRHQHRKLRGWGDIGDDDTTFTNVTELTTKRDFSTNNESLNVKSIPLCSSVNRMQVIAEETLPTGDGATEIDFYEEDDKSESAESSCASPTSIRFYQEDSNYDCESQESQEYKQNEKLHNYQKINENERNKKKRNENNNNENVRCRQVNGIKEDGMRKNGATIVKLNMPIDHILSRIRRPGLKVYCYRFWIEANRTNWNAFHSRKDRRIEAIGRATTCHIRLKAKTSRQSSGFLKQEVVVYAPTMLALEKCCNLFDEKFPRFYASNEFRKLKNVFKTNS